MSPNDHDERAEQASYAKGLGDLLASLPEGEEVARLSLDLSTQSNGRGGLRRLTPLWVVITVKPAGINGVRETIWRGTYLPSSAKWHLSNVGFTYRAP